ncbi:MAG: rhodanese-like domain-containing protein [Bacteroidota bacterium]
MELLRKLFGLGPKVDLARLVKDGAVIVDVRTKGEYAGGHIKGSVNIPLDQLPHRLNQLNKNKVIITCCASGMRSASARHILKSNGFEQVHNGGGWGSLQYKLI